MKGRIQAVVVGFALANLYLLSITGPLVSSQHELIFHLPGSANLLFVPAILDVLLVSGFLGTALLLAQRRPRAMLLIWSALLLVLPSGLINTLYGFQSRRVPAVLGWSVALSAILLFCVVNLRPRLALARLVRVQSFVNLLFSFLAVPELIFFLQLIWCGWEARQLNPPFRPAPVYEAETPRAAGIRIVWVVLDELSFDQVYGHRYPGLKLPNFDRLASQSTVLTNAASAADSTRIAIPSMLTGLPLSRTQPTADGQHVNLYSRNGRSHRFLAPEDTVFGDAQRSGLQTAIAGWYEPYCRLLPGVLNRCFWTYSDELPAGLTSGGTLLQHTFEPFLHFLRLVFRPAGIGPVMPTYGALDVRLHRADHASLLAASDTLLRSGQPGLILIHMPIPHPWGFYDRRTGTFPDHRTSYLDNLALADAYIGRVREELEQKGVWDSTTVLVTGDHSWRTGIWSTSAHWTAEEQAASHGGAFDARPAVILKLAGQQVSVYSNTRFDAVRVRALLDAVMTRKIATPEDLAAWLSDPAKLQSATSSSAPAPGPAHPPFR